MVPALPPAPRREVLAAVLSLARDADQPQLWTWLAADPQGVAGVGVAGVAGGAGTAGAGGGVKRPPPRLTAFLFLLCDSLEAFEHRNFSAQVGRCRLTLSNPSSNRLELSA